MSLCPSGRSSDPFARRAGRCSSPSSERSGSRPSPAPSSRTTTRRMSPSDRADFNPLDVNFVGVQLAQLAIGVLGVLVISGEYSTGMIRSSMCAVPRRLPVLWAKAAVYALVTLALMLPGDPDRFFRGTGVPVVPAHQHRVQRARCEPRRRRGRAVPRRGRRLRIRDSAPSRGTPPAASQRSPGSCSSCRR